MKAILLMFDSLNRAMLPPYGGTEVHAPNFERLAGRATTFDKCFVGSMPCMPARRELHTGRYNFLHRGWGPLEPFDDSMPALLKGSGVYTHLVTDHQHYFEDGGSGYHTQYNSWEFFRGQEGDPWKGEVADPEIPDAIQPHARPMWRQDWVNRKYMQDEADQPQTRTFDAGLEFIQTNRARDNWFLQIETFDPHEPFFTHQRYKDLYPHHYEGPHFDWPAYGPVTESEDQINHLRMEYMALVSMCDHSLGRVLDAMDAFDLWDDTVLIVCTDHGFLLGEHGLWAKNYMPWFNALANVPLFMWDPRRNRAGTRSDALVQMIDLAPTLLDVFGVPATTDMQGLPIARLEDDPALRSSAMFGIFGGHVNVTDGRYVYMRGPVGDNSPLYEYTLMPTRIWSHFKPDEFANATLAEPFAFTKGAKVLRTQGKTHIDLARLDTLLFDTLVDPTQEAPIVSDAIEARMKALLVEQLIETDAPAEQFERLGLQTRRQISDRALGSGG